VAHQEDENEHRFTCDAPDCTHVIHLPDAQDLQEAVTMAEKQGWDFSYHSRGAWVYCPQDAAAYHGHTPSGRKLSAY
jgi:hypothetical protein